MENFVSSLTSICIVYIYFYTYSEKQKNGSVRIVVVLNDYRCIIITLIPVFFSTVILKKSLKFKNHPSNSHSSFCWQRAGDPSVLANQDLKTCNNVDVNNFDSYV